jgi:hypothetical protein
MINDSLKVLPGRERASGSAAFESGAELSRVPGSFNEALRLLEEFPKPRSSSSSPSSGIARVEERVGTLDSGIAGIDDPFINDTKPDDGGEWSFGNRATVGVVGLESPVLEEPHHAPVRESPSDDSFSSR